MSDTNFYRLTDLKFEQLDCKANKKKFEHLQLIRFTLTGIPIYELLRFWDFSKNLHFNEHRCVTT